MRKRTGFTLIELLVVVTIIAVLVSILLPSLNKARAMAKSLLCISNQKQYGMATVMYAGNYMDFMPQQQAPNTWQYYWMDQLCPYLLQGAVSWLDSQAKVMYCPTSKRPDQSGPYHYPDYGYSARIGAMPFYLNGGYPMYQPRKLSGCGMPSRMVYLMDTLSETPYYYGSFDFGRDVLGTREWVVAYRDNKRTNNLFADGHVENVDIMKYTPQELILYYSYWQTWPTPEWN
jgi:prepilin-type N-terminal cleavage/methylation domain-containing protein/prepilin-type processing-associated H-X9-DG protein